MFIRGANSPRVKKVKLRRACQAERLRVKKHMGTMKNVHL